jgi:hypothetical protein
VSLRALAFAVAAAGAVASAAVFSTTFVPGGPLVPDWVIWPVFIGCLAVHLETVRGLRSRRAEVARDFRKPRKALALVAAVAFALSMHAVLTLHGSPEQHGSAYYLRNHTELTRVSRAEYRYAERQEERLFAGVALVFYLAAIVINGPAARTRPVQRELAV